MQNKKRKSDIHKDFQKIISNKEKYFEFFYNEYKKIVYGIAFSISKKKEDADDITQIVFIKILQMPNDRMPKSNELTWLYSMFKNETLNFIKNKKGNINIDELYNIGKDDNSLEKILDIDAYNRIINKLNKKEQEVVSLKILGQLSFKEISKILNIPIGTVQWKYYKAINTLKTLISNVILFIISTALYSINKTQMPKKAEISTEQKEDETTRTENKEIMEDTNIIKDTQEIIENSTNTQTEYYLVHQQCF